MIDSVTGIGGNFSRSTCKESASRLTEPACRIFFPLLQDAGEGSCNKKHADDSLTREERDKSSCLEAERRTNSGELQEHVA